MTALHSTPIDGPRGDAIAMMDLLKPHATSCEFPSDGLGVGDRIVGVGIKWLNHRPHAARCDSRLDEHPGIREGQGSSLDCDASLEEEFAQVEDSWITHVGGHPIRQFSPRGDQELTLPRVGFDTG
jgi:hypothetical protein